ncbi:MAG TPA: gamma-glutamyltransferase family protein [Vicinamibacterales bacterium]
MTVVTGRSKVATTFGIVAASQPLASRAGVQMLERGGHAVDAAIAANAVMGLVEPHMNGIGGDLFAMVYDAGVDRLHGLNAGGWAPQGLSPQLLRTWGFDSMPTTGIHSVTVPGAVAGWAALHDRFGRLPFRDLLAPAAFYARHGFPVSEVSAAAWGGLAGKLAADPHAARTYLPQGGAPLGGTIFTNPDLATSLHHIAAGGPAAFYRGPVGQAILTLSHEKGGTMTPDDLASFTPQWVDPISTTYRGWTVYELPPNTQGIAALMMLDLMETFPLGRLGLHSVDALHVMIEAKKLAYADMLAWVGDPRFFVDARVPALVDKARAAARARLVHPTRAAGHVEPSRLPGLTTGAGGDTIYLSVVDRAGNIVSLIQSIFEGFGSGLVAPGTGFALHNRGALFTLEDGHPNVLAPRKRPLHTIIPGFMRKDDVRIGFGIMGGFNQAQAHAQFVAHVADFGLDIQQALEAGRFTKPTFDGRDVCVEALVPDASIRGLMTRGHEVIVVPPRTGTFGYGQAVMSNGDGVHFGASEPRHDGAAIPEAPDVFSGT